jgi:PASTA domain
VQAAIVPADTTILASAATPALARAPWVSGRARVGAMMRCDVAWFNASAVRYVWLRGTRTIPSATTGAYRPRRADAGKALRCRSVAENPSGRSSATSKAVRIPRVCIVPTVVGLTLKAARARLKARSCRVGAVTIKRRSGRSGRVLRVAPSAGNLRPGGTKVKLVISRPKLKLKRKAPARPSRPARADSLATGRG